MLIINPCCCGGGGGTCADGQICLTVTECCSPFGAISGAAVAITRHSNGAAIGSCTTNGAGQCCVTVPGNDDYDYSVQKSGCSKASGTTHVNCGQSVNLGACLYCTPHSACINFHVSGCVGDLPGATIDVTGPDSGSGTSDSSGLWTFCTSVLGTFSYTVNRSRFNQSTGTFTISGLCGAGGGVSVSMTPAAGYTCCASAYSGAIPVPTTLYLSDGGGMITVDISSTCGSTVCHVCTMSHVGQAITVDPNTCGACPTCTGTGGFQCKTPPSITAGSAVLYYELDLSGAGNPCVQTIPEGMLHWDDTCTFCTPNHCTLWRIGTSAWNHSAPCCVTGCPGAVLVAGYVATAIVNSVEPFSMTFNFTENRSGNFDSTGTAPYSCPTGPAALGALVFATATLTE